MSLRTNIIIDIQQAPNDAYPDRNKRFILDFVSEGEISSSWQNLTDTARLKLPRNVLVEDELGNLVNWSSLAIYGDSGGASPLFMRGDQIAISLGYFIDNFDDTETLEMPTQAQFEGYISKIKNRLPIEIECEDEMWKLKQIPAPNKLFKGSAYTVKTMLEEMLKGTEYTVSDGGFATSIGDFRVQNETVAQVLERIKNEGGLYSYFRGKELRAGTVAYDPQVYQDNQHVFEFQENIITDNLEYTRKEDLNVILKATAKNIANAPGSNTDGSSKKTHKRIEVAVGRIYNNGVTSFGEIDDSKNAFGDTIRIPIIGAKTKAELLDRALKLLPKYYYTGFRGSIKTFGIPVVRHGEAIILRNNKITEQQGTYLVKQVTTSFGVQIGIKQQISIGIRIDQGFTVSELNAGAAG